MRKFLLPIVALIAFTFSSCDDLEETIDCTSNTARLSALLLTIDEWDCDDATEAYNLLDENQDCDEMKFLIEQQDYGTVEDALFIINGYKTVTCTLDGLF
ncbi:hypothetical protein [Sediminitomix flava]|uniref:Uncharacterized protein n=1 Tax=Sediminitomix flava TaxID=379075 RepID=A0A315ZDD9_SEDFL|nr:hypothetical protein [Sediminitomix flava]PWJ43139.1 hypothetical protein BC781_102688 [Sediminitomix flava]